jgi:hypothetical protein
MMADNYGSIDDFLTEIKTSLTQSTGEAMLRRINAERMLRLTMDELIEANQADRIRIMTDQRLAGEPGADFLLQVDDYDLRLELLDAPDNMPVLTSRDLPRLLKLLEDNSNTVALVLVWATDNLESIPFSVKRLKYIVDNPTRISNLLAEAKPLVEILRELMERQIKDWGVGLDERPDLTRKLTDTRHLFEKAIGQAIDAERGRSYRFVERRQAADQFPVEEEKRLIFSVLGEALDGVSANELVPKLTRSSRRGRA